MELERLPVEQGTTERPWLPDELCVDKLCSRRTRWRRRARCGWLSVLRLACLDRLQRLFRSACSLLCSSRCLCSLGHLPFQLQYSSDQLLQFCHLLQSSAFSMAQSVDQNIAPATMSIFSSNPANQSVMSHV